MTNQKQLRELQTAIADALQAMSQNELATKMGISPATIIAIKRGELEKISDKMLGKCRSFFQLDDWALRSTRNFQVIHELCKDATDNKRCLAVAGYTGAGKTTALEHFSKKNAGAYYCLAKPYHKPRSFLQAIQRSMGLSDGNSTAQIIESITSKMANTEGALLIIDDAGKLNSDCMRIIQCIYDDTERKAGIVLAGTEYLKKHIDAMAKANYRGFRELKRRISYWQPMYAVSKNEVKAICKDYGITDEKAQSYIYQQAGNYKVLSDLVMDGLKIANQEGEPVSREMLVDLRLGDQEYITAA